MTGTCNSLAPSCRYFKIRLPSRAYRASAHDLLKIVR